MESNKNLIIESGITESMYTGVKEILKDVHCSYNIAKKSLIRSKYIRQMIVDGVIILIDLMGFDSLDTGYLDDIKIGIKNAKDTSEIAKILESKLILKLDSGNNYHDYDLEGDYDEEDISTVILCDFIISSMKLYSIEEKTKLSYEYKSYKFYTDLDRLVVTKSGKFFISTDNIKHLIDIMNFLDLALDDLPSDEK